MDVELRFSEVLAESSSKRAVLLCMWRPSFFFFKEFNKNITFGFMSEVFTEQSVNHPLIRNKVYVSFKVVLREPTWRRARRVQTCRDEINVLRKKSLKKGLHKKQKFILSFIISSFCWNCKRFLNQAVNSLEWEKKLDVFLFSKHTLKPFQLQLNLCSWSRSLTFHWVTGAEKWTLLYMTANRMN